MATSTTVAPTDTTTTITSSIPTSTLTVSASTYLPVPASGVNLVYSGNGYLPINDANNGAAASTTTLAAYTALEDSCSAIQDCSDIINDQSQNAALDVHYLSSEQVWVCVAFSEYVDASDYSIVDPDVEVAFGYSSY